MVKNNHLRADNSIDLSVALERPVTYKHIIIAIVLLGWLILLCSTDGSPVGRRFKFSTSFFKMLTTNIQINGQVMIIRIAKIFAGITLVLIVLSVVGIWLKKYVLATITSIASVITFLATGTTLGNIVNPALAAAGIQQSVSVKYLTYQAAYYLQIILLILLAVFIYWLSGGEQLAKRLFLIAATISIASVLVITIYMLIIGLPAMIEIGPLKFLFGTVWDPEQHATAVWHFANDPDVNFLYDSVDSDWGSCQHPDAVLQKLHPNGCQYCPSRGRVIVEHPSVIYGFFALQILSPFVKRVLIFLRRYNADGNHRTRDHDNADNYHHLRKWFECGSRFVQRSFFGYGCFPYSYDLQNCHSGCSFSDLVQRHSRCRSFNRVIAIIMVGKFSQMLTY